MCAHRVSALLIAAIACAGCGSPGVQQGARPPAATVVEAVGDQYADLERLADSLVAAADSTDGVASERAQVAARQLALRIGGVRDGFETITLAMTTDQLVRTEALWMQVAVSQAALELLYEDATRLSRDPAASAAEVYDLAAQLSGSLELGLVSSRMVARQL